MPVLTFNVNAPGLDQFICFLFLRVGPNRFAGRQAATSRDMHRQVTLYRSQWVVEIPSVIFFPDTTMELAQEILTLPSFNFSVSHGFVTSSCVFMNISIA